MGLTSSTSTTFRFGQLSAAGIVSVGAVLSASHLFHLFTHQKSLPAQFLGAVFPFLLALGVVYAGYWTFRSSWSEPWRRRLFLWTLVGALAMGALGGLMTLHQSLSGAPIGTTPFLLTTAATGGSLGGFLIGFFQTQYRRKAERIETIHEATRKLMTAHTKAGVCDHATSIAADGLDMSLTGVWLANDEGTALEPAAATAEAVELFDDHPVFEPGNSISWDVFREGSSRYIADVASDPDAYNPNTPIRSELILPLDGHGVFNIGSRHPDAFDAVDVTTAEILASTTTAALDRATREETLQEQRHELQQQTARLEDFARTVSHDLRNPLSVASLRLELARERDELEHLADVEAALDRMETIVEDVLWLAQEGKQIGEKEATNLGETAQSAWSFVETQDATVRCDCDRRICADSDRLQQLFENLFRNSIEHGGDVTITVGTLPGGFYVEDTGPGIPKEDRESIFETGYSTAADGSGFGLSIVEQIAEAHGWEIAATDGDDGGARFEITDVEPADSDRCS